MCVCVCLFTFAVSSGPWWLNPEDRVTCSLTGSAYCMSSDWVMLILRSLCRTAQLSLCCDALAVPFVCVCGHVCLTHTHAVHLTSCWCPSSPRRLVHSSAKNVSFLCSLLYRGNTDMNNNWEMFQWTLSLMAPSACQTAADHSESLVSSVSTFSWLVLGSHCAITNNLLIFRGFISK